MNKLILLFILFTIFSIKILAQPVNDVSLQEDFVNNSEVNLLNNFQLPTNKQITDSLLNLSAIYLRDYIYNSEYEYIYIEIVRQPLTNLFEYQLVNICSDCNYRFTNNSELRPIIKIVALNHLIDYSYAKNSENIIRKINLSISAMEINQHGKARKIEIPEEIYKDEISIESISLIEVNHPDFLKAKLPLQKASTYEKIIEPIIVVSSAILTIALFFSIRSN